MTSDGMLALKFWWTTAFRLLKSVHLPGTNITPLSMIFFVAVTAVTIKFIVTLFGVGGFDGAARTEALRKESIIKYNEWRNSSK